MESMANTFGNGRTEAEEHADDSRMIRKGMRAAFPPLAETERPSLHDLWQQAGGGTDAYDAKRYVALMREHGHILKDAEPRKQYEWHEECDGPICQGCEGCICEGGCNCPTGPKYSPEVADYLSTCKRIWFR
jgi:hypothetical protein